MALLRYRRASASCASALEPRSSPAPDTFSPLRLSSLPSSGRAHVCYLPAQPRLSRRTLQSIVSMHSQRLQVQERLTRDVALDVQLAAGAAGVMVVVEAGHMCMVSRGVEKPGSSTCSTAALGVFAGDQGLRTRFLGALRAAARSSAAARGPSAPCVEPATAACPAAAPRSLSSSPAAAVAVPPAVDLVAAE